MEVTCLVLSLLALVGLIGYASYSQLRKPSSASSRAFSGLREDLEESQRAFQRQMTGEWEDWYAKMRAIVGRIDRARRKDGARSSEEDGQEPVDEDPIVAINRAILQRKGVRL